MSVLPKASLTPLRDAFFYPHLDSTADDVARYTGVTLSVHMHFICCKSPVSKLPEQEKEANAFLSKHKPADQGVNITDGTIVVFYEDGQHSPAYEIANYEEFLRSVDASTFQMEVALFTMQSERDGLNPTHNAGKYEEISSSMINTQRQLKLQAAKKEFLKGKIAELREQK